jgi:hypothetical protein
MLNLSALTGKKEELSSVFSKEKKINPIVKAGAKFQEIIGATGATFPERVSGLLTKSAKTAKELLVEYPARATASLTLEALREPARTPITGVEK